MNGGKLVQDCCNHARWGTHGIIDEEGHEYEITSTHHQMQYPYNLDEGDYHVLFTAQELLSPYHWEGDNIDKEEIARNGEPEIVLYHKEGLPKCLAIQGHPEIMRKDAPVVEMLNNLINETLSSIEK